MQNNEYVYFLSVKQAMELAKKHGVGFALLPAAIRALESP